MITANIQSNVASSTSIEGRCDSPGGDQVAAFLDAIASSSSYPCQWWWVIISDLPSISALSAMSALVALVTLGVQQFVILLFSINIWWPIWDPERLIICPTSFLVAMLTDIKPIALFSRPPCRSLGLA